MKVKNGVDDMDYRARLMRLIDTKQGIILTKDTAIQGIPRQYLSIFIEEGLLERIAHGIYLSPDAFEDEMYTLQATRSRAVFSHETALYLHDLTDRDPLEYSVTIPAGYNGTRLREAGVKVYAIKKELHNLGVSELKTSYGRIVKVYDKERTICDIIRNRNNMDIAILNEAIKGYLNNKDRNIPLLLRYAKELDVQKILRKYMEILL